MKANTPSVESAGERPIDRWFASYARDHQHPTNQLIHCLAVPLILWSVIEILWTMPVVATWFRPGLWAALSMFFACCRIDTASALRSEMRAARASDTSGNSERN